VSQYISPHAALSGLVVAEAHTAVVMTGKLPADVLLELRLGLAFLGVAWSADGSQGGEHLLGYPLHGRFLVWAAGEEVESGEAEAEEVS
jgi:hypothetical protein